MARERFGVEYVMRVVPPLGHVVVILSVYNELGIASQCKFGYLAIFSAPRRAPSRIKTESGDMCGAVEIDNPQVYAVEVMYLYLEGSNV